MLIGSVSAIQDSGLIITLLAYDQGPRRDFDGLKLTVFLGNFAEKDCLKINYITIFSYTGILSSSAASKVCNPR